MACESLSSRCARKRQQLSKNGFA